MKQKSLFSKTFPLYNLIILVTVTTAFTGCTTDQQNSQAARGATIGAAAGAILGGVIGHQSGEVGEGAVIGAAAGAAIGGLLGNKQDNQQREREQEAAAQERAYQEELERIQTEEKAIETERNKELAISQGQRISTVEIEEAQKRAAESERRLQALKKQKEAAVARYEEFQKAEERRLAAEKEIETIEAELKGTKTISD